MAPQITSVTDQVEQLGIVDNTGQGEQTGIVDNTGEHDFLDSLFAVPASSILGPSPPPPTSATPKEKCLTPSRRSIRQAGMPSSIPVAQRATIRLAKELDAIQDEDKRLDAAAAALVERFKEPLNDIDIDGLAALTRIDRDAILRVATQATIARAAATAH
jgi:hypothetical protein